MNAIDQRAALEGIRTITPPSRLFVPYVHVGEEIFTSGHTSDIKGVLGGGLDLADGREAAVESIVRLLSAVHTRAGTLEGLGVASLRVYVRSNPDFGEQPAIADAASELVHRVFGVDAGEHSRSAIGVAALPHGVAVEIEAVLRRVAS